ncbi:MAG: hypothetical protein H6742_13055 [Alphaproteobacteria bacterium]|nr:hypothetical protein [Alphaproteobacteria bacterium]
MRHRRRGRGLLLTMSVIFLSCAGCCCGGIPLFGLGPDLDPMEVEWALMDAPFVVDHTCSYAASCDEVDDVEVDLVPVSYHPLTGKLVVVADIRATCKGSLDYTRRPGRTFACVGLVAAVFVAADGAWELRYVTESPYGDLPSGEPDVHEWSPSTGGGGWPG